MPAVQEETGTKTEKADDSVIPHKGHDNPRATAYLPDDPQI